MKYTLRELLRYMPTEDKIYGKNLSIRQDKRPRQEARKVLIKREGGSGSKAKLSLA